MTGYWVKRPNLVHVRQIEDNLIANGNAPTNETSVSTLGANSDLALIAPFDDFADLFGSLGLQDRGRLASEAANPVAIVLVELVCGCRW